MKHILLIVGVATLAMITHLAFAEDRMELDKANIQGASELPKVLYIVPWKKAEIGTRPVKINRMVDEVLSPVDREVLQREIKFYEQSQVK